MTSQLCGKCNSLILGDRCPHCKAPRSNRVVTAAAVVALGLVLSACDQVQDDNVSALYGVELTDDDNDGYHVDEDCDDNDPDIHPDAEETAGDGVDSNCDGEDDPQT